MAGVPEGLRLRPVKTQSVEDAAGKKLDDGSEKGKEGSGGNVEDLDPPVSPTGRLFLHDDFYTIILCALEFRDRMELDHLRAVLRDTLAHHPRFHSKVVEKGRGAPVWVPVEVNISDHVVEARLEDAEAAHPETAVEHYMGRMASFPHFNTSRPLWDAHLLHIPRPKSASSCVFRIHHSLGDGTSLMSLLLACTRQTSNPSLLPTLPGNRGGTAASIGASAPGSEGASDPPLSTHVPSEGSLETLETMAAAEGNALSQKGNQSGGSLLASFRRGLTVAWNSVCHISQFLAVVAAMPDTATVLKATPGLHSAPKMVAVTADILLEDVSQIRRAAGVTVNDVMMALLSLAVEKYLQKRQGEGRLPARPRVTAVGLVNLRKSPGLQQLKVLMAEDHKGSAFSKNCPWGNYMGTYLLPLPVRPRAAADEAAAEGGAAKGKHARETLMAVKGMCDSKKLSLEAHWTYLNGVIIMATGGARGASFLLGRLTSQTTMSVSNMLGPAEGVSLGGNPVTAITPTVPPPNHAMCCHFQSYNGTMKAVLYMCLENIPEPQILSDCFMESFEELKLAYTS